MKSSQSRIYKSLRQVCGAGVFACAVMSVSASVSAADGYLMPENTGLVLPVTESVDRHAGPDLRIAQLPVESGVGQGSP
ncbi:MAG: hypothetical protein HKN47_14900, partial [Pirellulaceae bacterium]|nr:hypothetical protein [Pirellulaceae bacterium]